MAIPVFDVLTVKIIATSLIIMNLQLKYIELKTGHAHNGPAWIGYIEPSKSGKTIYFNGKALNGNGHGACSDKETREIYWVSGIKKNGRDRHWYGNGKIQIDKNAIKEYLSIMGLDKLDPRKYIEVEIPKTDKSKFTEIENAKLNLETDLDLYEDLDNLTITELENKIEELKNKEYWTNPINGLKFHTIKRQEAEKRLNKLKETKEAK